VRSEDRRAGRSSRISSRFVGEIAGVGTTVGPRIVLGRWFASPLGAFADVMIEEPDGYRLLLAPTEPVAEFVATTYQFDDVVVGGVRVLATRDSRELEAPGLRMTLRLGARPALGVLLRLQPRALARSPAWATLLDPVARTTLRGVRTRGSAGGRRREYYGATDLRRVAAIAGTWRGRPLGEVRPVDPPVRFGFGSVPREPSLTRLVTTIVQV
jgi:hypothetical protein